MTPKQPSRNRRSALLLSLLVVGMFGFGFALVPLYGLICDIAGIQRSSQAVPALAVDENPTGRVVAVKFDSTVHRDLPWRFSPSVRAIRVPIGKLQQVTFEVHNYSDRLVTGQAIPAVLPWQATNHFNKTECFCFRNQQLKPGETRQMKLLFMVSPDLPKNLDSITLSYTFMKVGETADGDAQ